MSKKPAASGPQKGTKYSLRVTMKKVDYTSDTSESEEYKSSSSSSESEVEPTPMVHPSDSDEEPPNEFLQRRAQNIKNNKAMLAKLMADLKLPEPLAQEPAVQNDNYKQRRRSREPLANVQPRRNPDRASRRITRSYAQELPPLPSKEEDQPSLEDQLLEEREPARRRRSARPSIHAVPHVVRPVDEITEKDLKNVADNVKTKVYSAAGSTCHQCRQKTRDTKSNCRNEECRGIQGQFCGPCLRNRYGEDVRKALLDPQWTCPPCRGICNCSFCRQRDGRCATGILYPLARHRGYSDVHSYLSGLRKKGEDSDEDEQ